MVPGHIGNTDLHMWIKIHVPHFGDGSPLLQLALIDDEKVAAKVFEPTNHEITNFSGKPKQIKILILCKDNW